jgi:hypothetical protein
MSLSGASVRLIKLKTGTATPDSSSHRIGPGTGLTVEEDVPFSDEVIAEAFEW